MTSGIGNGVEDRKGKDLVFLIISTPLKMGNLQPSPKVNRLPVVVDGFLVDYGCSSQTKC